MRESAHRKGNSSRKAAFFLPSRQRRAGMPGRQGDELAYLCYETWHRGGRARRVRGSHRLGCPGRGTPCPGRVWKRGGDLVSAVVHTGEHHSSPTCTQRASCRCPFSSASSTRQVHRVSSPVLGTEDIRQMRDRLCPREAAILRGE